MLLEATSEESPRPDLCVKAPGSNSAGDAVSRSRQQHLYTQHDVLKACFWAGFNDNCTCSGCSNHITVCICIADLDGVTSHPETN